ncbi:hypothetical protein [Streptomyces sp. NBC_01236]|uniref:hypothetical protein n=1 Tax=Streptomyces sp. NBC_01236 TaxID=2903789 RepID=UPI002E1487AE|nr:hypothetical protein OG324_31590 [Streptomyces sp. NBC_01236]
MRRSLFLTVLFGMAVAPASAGAVASADDLCGDTFKERLQCWSQTIDKGAVHVTLDGQVQFDSDARDRQNRRDVERTVWNKRDNLVVEVPAGARTGEGGTVLLLLAKTGWVAENAQIAKLPPEAVKDLQSVNACPRTLKNPKDLCTRLATGPLPGSELIAANPGSYRPLHAYSVAAKGGKGKGNGNGNGSTPSSPPTSSKPHSSKPSHEGSSGKGWDGLTQLLAGLCVVLVVLLAVLLFLIRRSSRAVGTLSRRALATPGVGAVPVTAARTHAPDETTTRLRVTPTPRYGRRVGNVPGPARSAVVRTELHPQGYVELDRVLYRAVWAEPGRPPPAPGGLVDVTDARERDSDVLYAFPPTTGRHAKGTRQP